jgi:sister-chromatid-cohesion protein PDS5
VQVCNATADKLQRHVCQYFTDIVVSHSRDEEFDDIKTAHDLVRQINRSCPALLHSVMPQLEEELRVEDIQLRMLASQVLGEMFADQSGHDLVKKYPSTWNMWLQRKNDKSPAIRLRFVEAAKSLLINLPDHREAIEGTNCHSMVAICVIVLGHLDALSSKLLDPDEKVRAAVCKIYSQLDYETALLHVSKEQLQAVASRGADKKVCPSDCSVHLELTASMLSNLSGSKR